MSAALQAGARAALAIAVVIAFVWLLDRAVFGVNAPGLFS